jgi:hypothetical protein
MMLEAEKSVYVYDAISNKYEGLFFHFRDQVLAL